MIETLTGATALTATGFPFDTAFARSVGGLKGNIHHSVSRWCYDDIPFDSFAKACVAMGIESVELLEEKDWAIAKQHSLTCAVGYATSFGIPKGFNRLENHDKLAANFEAMIPKAAAAGVPNLICFSGNSEGQSDAEGIAICALGLKRILPLAEKYGVTILMELLNTTDHPDYQCKHTGWGVALCENVKSTRLKLLYDIYHMQIMEGNVIDSIRKYHRFIGHYHTGGVPGRNEIDETQELYYPAIMRAIVKTGYTGFVGQEFVPSGNDKLAALRKCIEICDV